MISHPAGPSAPFSTPIEVDGAVVGTAIRQSGGVRFIAASLNAGEMDQTLWPSLDAVRTAARQLVRTGRIDNFQPKDMDD
jgi:hypothetical protein